jgi:hypothetical protein
MIHGIIRLSLAFIFSPQLLSVCASFVAKVGVATSSTVVAAGMTTADLDATVTATLQQVNDAHLPRRNPRHA